jgi:hypothetical protein
VACVRWKNLLLPRANGSVKIDAWIIYGSNFKSFRHDLLLVIYRPTNILSKLDHQIISVAILWPRNLAGVPSILRGPPSAQHKRCLIMPLPFLLVPRRRQSTKLPWHDGCLQDSGKVSLLIEDGCLALSLPGLQVSLLHKLELLLKREAGWGLELVCQILNCLIECIGAFSKRRLDQTLKKARLGHRFLCPWPLWGGGSEMGLELRHKCLDSLILLQLC